MVLSTPTDSNSASSTSAGSSKVSVGKTSQVSQVNTSSKLFFTIFKGRFLVFITPSNLSDRKKGSFSGKSALKKIFKARSDLRSLLFNYI